MNRYGVYLIVTLLSSVYLTACGESVKSVEWWQKHPEEQKQGIADCKKEALNGSEASESCKNLNKAIALSFTSKKSNTRFTNFD